MADWDNSRGDNGFGVATAGNGGLRGLSTPWSRALDRWSVEAKRAEDASYLRARVRFERSYLAELAERLAATETGKKLHKRRAIAETNARYVHAGGRRKYVGKKKSAAKKQRRADAAWLRRAKQREKTRNSW